MIKDTTPVAGYEGLYSVSKDGKVYSHRRRFHQDSKLRWVVDINYFYLLKNKLSKRGYYVVTLYPEKGRKKTTYLHRILMTTFVPNPENLEQVNHKNGIKTDCRLENMEWCTQLDNICHAVETGLLKTKGEDNSQSKLDNTQRFFILGNYIYGHSVLKLAKMFNMKKHAIYEILNRNLPGYILWYQGKKPEFKIF